MTDPTRRPDPPAGPETAAQPRAPDTRPPPPSDTLARPGALLPPAAGAVAVPGYEITRELGRGGMGVVYEARQLGLNRLVALKMIRGDVAAGPDAVARFRREAEALARLQHPHVVQVHEVGVAAGQLYFSEELVTGGNLAERLAADRLLPARAARLVETLARAVHAVHRCGIVHRDLKPGNVLLTDDGEPKITDFGLAKWVGDETGQTVTGAVMGTPSYMAPEQAVGAKDVGPAADVYALGAILYELLSGRPPFRADTVFETMYQVRFADPVPPRQFDPGVPRDLETVCLKCLQKEPRKRYASAEELADDLRRFRAGEPVRARRAGVLERAWRRVRRNPWPAVVVIVAAVTAAGVLAFGRPGAPPADRTGEEYEQVLAELDARDPGWKLEDIDHARFQAPLPDDQNSAIRTQTAVRLLPKDWRDPPDEGDPADILLDPVFDLAPPEPLPRAQADIIRAELRRLAPALAEARPLADLPRGRYRVYWSRDAFGTLLGHAQECRGVNKLLLLDAVLRAEDGDPAGAVASCRASLNAGRSIDDEPIGISQLVRTACAANVVRGLERVLAGGEPPADALATAQQLLEDEARHPHLLIAARGDRGGIHWLMSGAEVGDVNMERLLSDSWNLLTDTPMPPDVASAPELKNRGYLRAMHTWLLRHHTAFVELARLPAQEQLRQAERLNQTADREAEPAARALLPTTKFVKAFLRIRAGLRAAAVAVAAERYRQAHDRWPESLAALVPAQLRDVPADPYDGAPLRYRRTTDGVLVYAIGRDGRDDQGTWDKNPDRDGADVVFRLWDPAHRAGRTR